MWDPLLRRDVESASVRTSRIVESDRSLVCLLDPPLHAIGEERYRSAQHSVARLYAEIQRSGAPMPVALQEDFRRAYETARAKPFAGVEPFIDAGGFGIVAALLDAKRRPEIVALEQGFALDDFEERKQRSVRWMERATPFLGTLLTAFDTVARTRTSARFREIRTAADDRRAERITLRAWVLRLTDAAAAQGIPLPSHLTLFRRLLEMDEGIQTATIEAEQSRLAGEIKARGDRSSLPPRAAVELYLHELVDRHGADPLHADAIETLRAALREDAVPYDTAIVRHVSAQLVDGFGEYVGPGIRIRPGEEGRPHRGHGELASRLLDVAAILDIDISRYPALRDYVYYTNGVHELDALCGFETAGGINDALADLEEEVLHGAAETEVDRGVVRLGETMLLLSELRHFRIGYGAGAQKAMRRLRLETVAGALLTLGATLPAGWEDEARGLDETLDVVTDFNERSAMRGKQLGDRLVAELARRGEGSMLAVCDGFLQNVVTGAVTGHASYTFLIPKF